MFRRLSVIVIAAFAVIILGLLLRDDGRDSGESETGNDSTSIESSSDAIGLNSMPSSVKNTIAPRSVWQRGVATDVTIPGYTKEIEDAVLVDIDVARLGRLEIGDAITIFIPQLDKSFSGTVSEIKSYPKKVKVLKGSMGFEPLKYSFVITLGQKNTFANVYTPSGSYELVGNSEHGWLMPSVNMDKNVNYDEPDYILPRREPIPE